MRPQVVHFLRRHLEGEIGRETVLVALECLIELLRRDTIDLGKIGIQDDPLLAEGEDGRLVRGGSVSFGEIGLQNRQRCRRGTRERDAKV